MGPILVLLKTLVPRWKGESGEHFVTEQLLGLDPSKYSVISDLLLPSQGNISTTQIDQVVVSNFGIFVIETKAYSGWIFGDARWPYWTQTLYHHKSRFYNPIRQNYGHIKAVETLVRPHSPVVPVVGFIAFPSADRIRVSGTYAVGTPRDIIRKIKAFTDPVLTDERKFDILQKLQRANILDPIARKAHIRNAKELKTRKEK